METCRRQTWEDPDLWEKRGRHHGYVSVAMLPRRLRQRSAWRLLLASLRARSRIGRRLLVSSPGIIFDEAGQIENDSKRTAPTQSVEDFVASVPGFLVKKAETLLEYVHV